MVISINGVGLMDVSSLANCDSYSLRNVSNCDLMPGFNCDDVDQKYLVVPV